MSEGKTTEDDAKPADDGETALKGESSAEDAANPEAIARRVAALGEEDEIDRIARAEEQKLAERRAAQRKGKKKTGLEAAASKKLSKIGTRAEPQRRIATASAAADPLIERTAKLSDWAKKNQKTVQIVGALIAAALLGVAGFLYFDHKRETDASVLLTKAVADERARIGEPPKDDEEGDGAPVFKTYDERREAALKKYREVQAQFPKTGAAILSRLAEGSLLLDKRDADGALKAFDEVKASPLAAADQEVHGRAIESSGFAYELKADKDPASKDKNLDEAMKAYKELENTVDVKGFKELAMYHQARVSMAKGDNDKAKELLTALRDRMSKADEGQNPIQSPAGPSFPYLQEVSMDRLREVDPSAAPKAPPGGGAGAGGNPQLTPAQIKKMMEELKKGGGAGGAGGHGH